MILKGLILVLARLVCLIVPFMPCGVRGQWTTASFPIEEPQRIEVLRAYGDELYCSGTMRIYPNTDSAYYMVMVRTAADWDTLGRFDDRVMAIHRMGDTLLVGGQFTHIDSVPFDRIAARVNGQWIPYGSFDWAVTNIEEINGALYATGGFSMCDQQPTNGMAVRSNGQWQAMPMAGLMPGAAVYDLEVHDGDLYAVGTLTLASTKGVAHLVNGVWEGVGPGILGSIYQVRAVESFQGKLYVSGAFDIAAGNAGHAIMAWNGTAFEPLNIGPQAINGSYQYFYRANTMLEVPGGLLIGGGFNYVDGQPASRMALWDGTNWCGLGGTIGGEVYSIANHNDTLYVSATDDPTFNGVDMNGLAWYQFPVTQLNCTFLGVEQELLPTEFGLYPNPTDGVFSIAGSPSPVLHVRVCDLLGRTMFERSMQCAQGGCSISLVGSPSGVYSIAVLQANGWRMVGRLVKE
jgi:hypothetical protein